MNITQEEAASFDGLLGFNSTALALDEGIQDWERILQTTLMVCFILIGVLLSIIISGGTLGWVKGWFNQDEKEDGDDEEEEEEHDDTLSSSSVAVEIGEEYEDVVELASISDVSVYSEMRSLPRPEEEDNDQQDNRLDSNDENDEVERQGWGEKYCYLM